MVMTKNKKTKKTYKTYKKKYVKKRTSMIKTIQNVLNKNLEKKRTDITYLTTDASMGQVSGSANGYYASEITPTPSIGSQINQRIGNNIKITGIYMTLQLRQMSASVSPAKLTFYIFRMKGDYSSTAAQTVGNCFNANEYIGGGGVIYDTQSSLNTDFFGTYTIIKKFNVYMKPDQFTGQQMPIAKNIPLKFKKPLTLQFYGSSGTIAAKGKLFLMGFSSCGNASTVNSSLLQNVPVSATNTGQLLNYNIKYYYTDA